MDFIHEELRKEKLKLLVSHIAPKNFKMIRRYGLYSRRAKKRKIKTFSFFRKMLTWTERIYRDFKRNPLSCNNKMIRRYGLYSRRAKKRKIKTFSFFRKMLTWTERIYRDFKRNPLSCNNCGTSM